MQIFIEYCILRYITDRNSYAIFSSFVQGQRESPAVSPASYIVIHLLGWAAPLVVAEYLVARLYYCTATKVAAPWYSLRDVLIMLTTRQMRVDQNFLAMCSFYHCNLLSSDRWCHIGNITYCKLSTAMVIFYIWAGVFSHTWYNLLHVL